MIINFMLEQVIVVPKLKYTLKSYLLLPLLYYKQFYFHKIIVFPVLINQVDLQVIHDIFF